MSKAFCCYSPNDTPPDQLRVGECPFHGAAGFRQLHVTPDGLAWCDLHVPLAHEIADGVQAPQPFSAIASALVSRSRSVWGNRIDLRRTMWRGVVTLDALRQPIGANKFSEINFSGAEFASGLSIGLPINTDSIKFCKSVIRGGVAITNSETAIDLSDASIDGKVELTESTGHPLRLQKATVTGPCSVTLQGENKEIDISDTKFSNSLKINAETYFQGPIHARNTEVLGDFALTAPRSSGLICMMSGIRAKDALAISAERLQQLDLSNATCGSVSVRAKIDQLADFRAIVVRKKFKASGVEFYCNAQFEGAKLLGHASFGQVSFLDESDFRGAIFGGVANFTGAIFKGAVEFQRAKFNKPLLIQAGGDEAGRKLPEADFTAAEFGDAAYFTNREFTGPTRFAGCSFGRAPSFHGCKFHQDTSFIGTKFLDVASDEAPAAYRTLKLAMESARAKNEEAMFYALEQRSLRRQMKDAPFARAMSWLYDWGSDYGRSIGLPLLWFVVFGGLAALGYWLALDNEMWDPTSFCVKAEIAALESKEIAIRHMLAQIVRPFEALTLRSGTASTSCIVPLGLATLSAIQTIFHLGSIALLFLAIRRRFKMD